MDERFLPTLDVVVDAAGLGAIQEQTGNAWDWLKGLRGHEEALLRAEVGELVSLPGLPSMFRLQVAAKTIHVERERDPYVRVTLTAVTPGRQDRR